MEENKEVGKINIGTDKEPFFMDKPSVVTEYINYVKKLKEDNKLEQHYRFFNLWSKGVL